MSISTNLSPQERLAASRKAIVKHMSRHHPEIQDDANVEIDGDVKSRKQIVPGKFSQIKYAARMWWQRHPASAAVDLARPLIYDYARAYPFKLLGISAVAGAVLVIARPWKMISGSALIIAAVKSSGLSNTLLTMLSSLATHSNNSSNS